MPKQRKKTRKYPPAYYRYKEKHPTISVCLTKELKTTIDLKKGDMSYSEFIKKLIEGNIPQIEEATPFWLPCSVCQEPMVISPNSESHRLVIKHMRKLGLGHRGCHERSEERTAAIRQKRKTLPKPHGL